MTDNTATHSVEDKHRAELNQAVQGHVFEETEGSHQRAPALPVRSKKGAVNGTFIQISIYI